MAEIFKFPDRDEWLGTKKLIAEKMKQEGFSDEAIATINQRVMAYREKYLDFGFDIHLTGLSPEAAEKVKEAFLGIESALHERTSAILLERVSTEIAILALD